MVTLTLPGALSKLLPVPLPFLETLCLIFGYRHFGMFCTGLHGIEGAGGMRNVVLSMIQSSGVWWCLLVLHRPWDWPISCAIWEPYLPWQDMNRQLHKNIKDSAGDCEAMRFEEFPHDWNWIRRTGMAGTLGLQNRKRRSSILEPAVWDSQESGWEWRSCQKLTVHSFPQVRWSSCFQELYWQRSTRTYGCQPWGCGWRPSDLVHLCYFLNGFPQN